MTSSFRIADAAIDDLKSIWIFIANDSPAAATGVLESIKQRFSLLASNPHIGSTRDELGASLRSLTVGNYVIYFRPLHNALFAIQILRVLHGARDASNLF